MSVPFFKRRADDAAHYRRDGDFVQVLSVLNDDVLGPSYDVVRVGTSQIIRGVRGPKSLRFAKGNTAFMRFHGGSHYSLQLEGVVGGSATVSVLSSGPQDTGDNDYYVLRSGDTLSGTLETEDKTLEVNFVDGLMTFRQVAGVYEENDDLMLSSAQAGAWGLSTLIGSLGFHHTTHENGGTDEINVEDLSGLLADAQTPLSHKTSHQDGGSDEISLSGLAGESATPQPPKTHASSHEDGGSDAVGLHLSDLTDAVIDGSQTDGQVLTWDDTNNCWIAADAPAGGSLALDDLTDVNAPTPSDGDSLIWDTATSKWIPAAVSGGGGTPTVELLAGSAIIPTTGGCSAITQLEPSTNKPDYLITLFDASAQEAADFFFVMPSDWNAGTIKAKFYWACNSTSTNSVRWGVKGRALADGDALDQGWGTGAEVSDAGNGTAYDVLISGETGEMTFAGSPAAGQLVHLRVYRNVAHADDTLAVDAALLAVKIEYGVS